MSKNNNINNHNSNNRKSSSSTSSLSDINQSNNSRPVSFYDNYGENGTTTTNNNINNSSVNERGTGGHITMKNIDDYNDDIYDDDDDDDFDIDIESNVYEPREITFEVKELPSQLYCLKTTVPQNILSSNIAGRHTPTRNSLRHSRMIVMHKTGKVPWKSLPPIIRYHRLAKALVGFQLFLGVALCFLSLWLFIWSPNIRNRDNPYWCALPLVLSGFVGLILLCCCRKEYPGMPGGYCIYFNKVISIILSIISGISCLTACCFALIHLTSITLMSCTPIGKLDDTCVCKSNEEDNINNIILIKSYHYSDLSCPELDILSILLIFSCVTNLIAGVISLWYVYLHWSSRYMYAYSKVRTKNGNNTPIIIGNTNNNNNNNNSNP